MWISADFAAAAAAAFDLTAEDMTTKTYERRLISQKQKKCVCCVNCKQLRPTADT